jgi:hypothetical protein
MCDCGCNTCETKGPLLTEGKVKSLLSEGLQYHIDKKIPIFETVYRIGSDKHLALIKEARKMYSRNVIDLCEDDEALIKTHLGEFALYEGESVPLDLPMLEESYDYDEVAQSEFGMDYDQLGPGEKEWVRDEIDNMLNEFSLPKFDVVKPIIDKFLGGIEKAGKKLIEIVKREGKQTLVLIKEIAEYVISGKKPTSAEQKKITEQLKDLGFLAFLGIAGNIPFSLFSIIYFIIDESGIAKEFLKLNEAYSGFRRGEPEDPDSIPFKPTGSVSEFREDLRALFGKFKGDLKNPEFIKGVAQIMVSWKSLLRSQLDEAKKAKKKEKKDPPIGKPKRGGSKAYYVYVRDPKTKKIKKVSFGSGGLRAKIRNPKARKAFAARHNCKNKKDRTKAGYWSCNLPRYAPALGLGAKMNTFW